MSKELCKIKGKVQQYAWGGFDFLPDLLQLPKEAGKPYAEYWLGAHPSAPASLLQKEGMVSLKDAGVALPWLFKVLDVREMLSIQLHPNKQQAEAGFAKENASGIPVGAFNRNYRDDNHKPELMVALSEFWLLHGFKQRAAIEQTLSTKKSLSQLLPIFLAKDNYGFYEYVMRMPEDEADHILNLLHTEINPYLNDKSNPDYWAQKAFEQYGARDKGIFSIYLFNLFSLQKGQGIFQAAGVPHAYLFGQNVELMSNSDNVLRGGLTPKHIDVDELLQLIDCRSIDPKVIELTTSGALPHYPTPGYEFQLNCLQLKPGEEKTFSLSSDAIILVLVGVALANSNGNSLELAQGESCYLPANSNLALKANLTTEIFVAAAP